MSHKSAVIAGVIVALVVGGALLLKANKSAETSSAGSTQGVAAPPLPIQGQPRFVDVGTTTCAPCRVMLGVMGELKQRYPDEMIVEFINTQERPAEAERLGIRIIPTQIFYSPDGKELFRHVGVLRTEEVVSKWAELGFPMKTSFRR